MSHSFDVEATAQRMLIYVKIYYDSNNHMRIDFPPREQLVSDLFHNRGQPTIVPDLAEKALAAFGGSPASYLAHADQLLKIDSDPNQLAYHTHQARVPLAKSAMAVLVQHTIVLGDVAPDQKALLVQRFNQLLNEFCVDPAKKVLPQSALQPALAPAPAVPAMRALRLEEVDAFMASPKDMFTKRFISEDEDNSEEWELETCTITKDGLQFQVNFTGVGPVPYNEPDFRALLEESHVVE